MACFPYSRFISHNMAVLTPRVDPQRRRSLYDRSVNAFMGVFDPVSFALITGGTIFGIIFRGHPGLTATLAVILLIPLSYGLEPTQGISMLVGVYIGGIPAGWWPPCLLGMPGTPSSMVTVLDGFALASRTGGQGPCAGVTANLAGSFIGWLSSSRWPPQVARFARAEFGPIENTAVLLFGFTAVISLSGGSISKGICMTALGMAFSTVGVDPISSMERNTLGFSVLTNGISQMPAMIGLFVVAQAFAEMDTPYPSGSSSGEQADRPVRVTDGTSCVAAQLHPFPGSSARHRHSAGHRRDAGQRGGL